MIKTLCITAISAFALMGTACSDSSSTKIAEVMPSAAHAGDMMKMETKVKAVLIYADWCGSCKVLDPKVEAAKGVFDGKGMEFLVLDFTKKDNADFYAQAEAAGVEPAIRAALGDTVKTGQILLVTADGDKVISKLTKELSVQDIAAKFKAALAS